MYKAVVNSIRTELAQDIDAIQTTISVLNASALQDTKLAVIGSGEIAETIRYESIVDNELIGCERGFQGVAKPWDLGTKVARNFTAYDHDTTVENINKLNEKVQEVKEEVKDITPLSIGAETPTGAQEKADAAQTAAEESAQLLVNDLQTDVNQLDSDLTTHTATQVHEGEAHGLRVTNGTLEWFNGAEWVVVKSDVITATTSTVIYYVDVVSGNNNNNGLSEETAFKTIKHAISLVPQIVNHSVVIYVKSGDYTAEGALALNGYLGFGVISLIGKFPSESPNGYRAKILRVSCVGCKNRSIALSFLETTVTGSVPSFDISSCSDFSLSNCTSVNASTTGVNVYGSTIVNIIACIISNKISYGLYVDRSVVFSQASGGTGNATGILATNGGTIIKNGGQPTGTVPELTTIGGQIR